MSMLRSASKLAARLEALMQSTPAAQRQKFRQAIAKHRDEARLQDDYERMEVGDVTAWNKWLDRWEADNHANH